VTEGVDYAWGRPGGAALAGLGKHFAMRYVPYIGDGAKGLLKPETANLRAFGLSIGLVFETTANRAKEGFGAGQNDARLTQIGLPWTGLPLTLPVYYAVDFDANVGQRTWDANWGGAIRSYFDGVASILGRPRVGIYGGYHVIEWALANGHATWGWQTYAWSNGLVSNRAHVYQYDNTGNNINGVSVDLCKSLRADFGQFPRPQGGGPLPPPPDLPDTALPGPLLVADGDHGVRFRSVDYNRVLKGRKPIRKGITVKSEVWRRFGARKNLSIIGRIDQSHLPASERPFGDVLITRVYVDSGHVFGYVKQIDIVGN
jgi:hypothetical protein